MFVEDKAVITNTPTKTGVGEQAKFLGCEGFLPKFTKLARKNYKIITSTKNICISLWAPLFSNQSTSSSIFAEISHNNDLKKRKKTSPF